MKILDKTLLSFTCDVYPDGHRQMADNDLKHTSKNALKFLEEMELTGGEPQLNRQT